MFGHGWKIGSDHIAWGDSLPLSDNQLDALHFEVKLSRKLLLQLAAKAATSKHRKATLGHNGLVVRVAPCCRSKLRSEMGKDK
jgi:hypothetical protein